MKNNSILPVAEFFSTTHCTTSISQRLLHIRDVLKPTAVGVQFPIAPLIITDFSWALINSSMAVFNNCTFYQYLKWSFEVLLPKSDRIGTQNEFPENYNMPSKIYLCSFHMIKKIYNKIKTIEASEEIKKDFLFAFSLLQNSASMKEFNNTLIDTFFIFNSKKNDSKVELALKQLKNNISLRHLDTIDCGNAAAFQKKSKELDVLYESSCNNANLKEESPFTKYFNSLLERITAQSPPSVEASLADNAYFNPELYDVFTNYLYIMPIWSGVILSY